MQLFTNNADSVLDGAIAADTTSITLSTGGGSKFPLPTGGDFFLATLFQKAGASEINHEIVKCVARAGDVLTVVRAQEGTTAREFDTGDGFELRVTAGTLANKEELVVVGTTDQYWRGDKSWQTLNRSSVGLGNVDNTSDANKPVSTAQQTALNLKANLNSPSFTGHAVAISSPASTGIAALAGNNSGYESMSQGSGATAGAATIAFHRPGAYAVHFGLDTDNKLKVGGHSLGAAAYSIYHEGNKPTKADVGLSNVNNTSDANKPISTATQTALNAKAAAASPTFTGDIYDNGSTRSNIVVVAALNIDCSLGNYFTKTINGASTFTFSNAPASRAYAFTLELTHTSGAVTWPASVVWPGNTAPTLTAGKTHLFTFVTDDGGTRWRGVVNADYPN